MTGAISSCTACSACSVSCASCVADRASLRGGGCTAKLKPWIAHDWLIQPAAAGLAPGAVPGPITLHFGTLSLEDKAPSDSSCTSFDGVPTDGCCDFVQIFDGPTIHSPLLAILCGSKHPGRITSTGPAMLVRLYVDGHQEGAGFSAVYTSAGFGNLSLPQLPMPSFPNIHLDCGRDTK
ncbi:uncharacterized protein AMSG_08980 [Thecamonas trahens ATCC 50062]|uniref:CUB domain-containing protein n=1 Tax=Thecamonas trahens ATCC 50062 TaxID=461836 RepID=A0A0L0DKK3_THETB|nr:hypothetical protein AMSG_08980 [Thecamonas trahens ATCC 50062]KNC52837.1 hypothetical protein AMSG_08980 [Thecamonas trahens ATCC 50062]|eukprot:XP_013754942.1 hypothetical protein AMSG_08980 [Thecamonas trahens ATCC 50062]